MRRSLILLGLTWIRVAYGAPPEAPELVSPADGAVGTSLSPTLTIQAADADGDALTARFSGRALAAPGEDFTLIVLPDTQFYACGCAGGSTDSFGAQTAWVAEQQAALNIAYVAQLGDCVQNGDEVEAEWQVADEAFSAFDEGRSTYALPPGGLPYSVAVGNHDQSPMGDADGTTTLFNAYFGIDRFSSTAWYGGYYGSDYDNHYDLFEAGGTAFVVVYLEYDESPDEEVLHWADEVIAGFPDRHAIVVSHYLMEDVGDLSVQGQATYAALSANETLFLMLAGHVSTEARREDNEGPRTVHSLLSDYQSRSGGGDGWLRIMAFQPALGQIVVSTYSPVLGEEEIDDESTFTLSWDANPAPWTALGEVVVTDGEASLVWSGLSAETNYEWRVELSDGTDTTEGGPWTFTTGGASADTAEPTDTAVSDTAPKDSGPAADSDTAVDSAADGAFVPKAEPNGCGCAHGGASALILLGLGLRRRRADRRPVSAG